MHSRLLKHFLAIYEARSLSAAAAAHRISQPALTKSLQSLELEFGVKLFERIPTGVQPTRYGEVLARRVRLMDIEYRHAIAEIDAMRGGKEGQLRIGAGPIWITRYLPPVVADYQRLRPEIRIYMESGVIDTLVPLLQRGEFDLVCASLDFPNQPDLVKEALVNIEHVVVAAQTHPLAGQGMVTAQDLAGYSWAALAKDQVGTGRILSYFAAYDCNPPQIAVETSSTPAMFDLLNLTDYLCHIPRALLPHAAKFNVVPLALSGTFWETPAGIIYRQSENRLPALTQFIRAMRESFEKGS
ncbi:LysR family transcriptional regulator [Labrenzia sp. 011]|uniref:LysR family transcriptional regulator n=1 Tax=Labrenzia sp. 011 TaxID=2171494 RepID=UPI000D522AA0|nr:LysR family transcriptional regulator [Labrenzia sp. 011]PVB62423.1 hypothetical protein DCO57_06610 [Labrenzia sp. 011]